MNRLIIMMIGTIAALTLLASAPLAGEDHEHYGPPPSDDPRFEFLKSLAGTWVGPPLSEGMPEGVYEFRVTAGGHAVEEREMVGTPMEMVTLYHMEGRNLVATHYCVLGNQPRLTAAKKVVDDALSFSCTGKPGSARSHDDEHVHAWSMRLQEGGKLAYSAELVKDGEVTQTPTVVLSRRIEKASR